MPLPDRRRRWLVALAFAVALVVISVAVLGIRWWNRAPDSVAIEVLSSRPETVSGGTARVRVTARPAGRGLTLQSTVAGRDVSAQLRRTGSVWEGVLTDLPLDPSVLEATVGDTQATPVTLVNHPRSGPVFAGPQEEPFACQSQYFALAGGGMLGPALDAQCTVAERIDYVYRSTAGDFKPLTGKALTDPDARPADLARTTLPGEREVPFIVAVKTSGIDRGVAETAMLADPAVTDPATAGSTSAYWNRRLVYTFGGGCEGGWYIQGVKTGGVLEAGLLAQGYALTSNTLNVFANNCDDLLAAESAAMTREQFIEDHGQPDFTIGAGCSGGSYQAQQIADNYPGLLDGIVVGCSLSDVGFGVGQALLDSRLLDAYRDRFPDRLTPDQLRAVSGFGSVEAVDVMSAAAVRFDPTGNLNTAVSGHPRTTVWDHAVNVYGRAPGSDAARRPWGNVGVQYGLQALQRNEISVEQFVALNRDIGGLDLSLTATQGRTQADPVATERAYASGRLLNGGGGLATTPIIDVRAYTDGPASKDFHLRYQTFIVQRRLVQANGDAANQVRWTVPGAVAYDLNDPRLLEAIDGLARWLTPLRATPTLSPASVVAARPVDLVDSCWTTAGQRVVEEQTYDGPGECNRLYPAYAAPRLVAGEPLTADVVDCRLRPLDVADYPRLDAVQRSELRRAFPSGVCDWNDPGLHRVPLAGTWQRF